MGHLAFPISKHGDSVCLEPTGCLLTTEETKRLADILQDFIRHQAKLSICMDLGKEGGWRRFMVRCNQKKELMLLGIANPRLLRVQQLIDEKENYRDFITRKCQDAGLNLRSLYFQPCPHTSCSPQSIPYDLLYGNKTLTENINQLEFLISPDSYFPSNTKASELFYSTIRKSITDCFEITPDSENKPLIINANCRIGVLAAHLADMSSKIIGVDMSPHDIDNAKHNAEVNKIKNCEFINSNFEIVLERLLTKYSKRKGDTMVVCNPPPSGLHRDTIESIRCSNEISKMVYVTPKIDHPHVMDNLLTLCTKRAGKVAPPFAPISATPVDMNPLTEKFETVILLERLD